MLRVTALLPRLWRWIASLLIASVWAFVSSVSAMESPLAWAGLEGAVLMCGGPPCDHVDDFFGRAFFYNANDLFVELYEFERSADGTLTIHKRDTVRLPHLTRIIILEHLRGAMPNAPSWVGDPTAHYLILRLDGGSTPQLALTIWRPSGLLPASTVVFTANDMQQFSRWPRPVQDAIREGRILIGMTASQVAMSKGRPRKRERVTDAGGVTEVWSFGQVVEVFFAGGKVARVREQLRP
jgi:hypothetical protein